VTAPRSGAADRIAGGRGVATGRLVLDDRVEPGRIVVEDGRIAAVEPDPAAADGPLIAPGFVDIHVHGWAGHDALGSGADLDGMARGLLRHGVTSFLPTAVTAPLGRLADFCGRVSGWAPGAPADGARPLGSNLEGPFLAVARSGAQDPDQILDPAAVPLDRLEPLVAGLRLMTVAPERPGALELIRWCHARGIRVSLGHSAADLAAARAGYAAGASGTTHLFNAMTGLDHHAPGLAAAALTDDAVYVELIADGHHVDPSLWPIITRAKPVDRLVLVSDAISLGGTNAVRGVLGGLEVAVRGGRCTLVASGALAGSVTALDAALGNLVRSGVDLAAAVAAASRNPLTLLGVGDRGRIAVGQLAHLVELADDLAVRRVTLGEDWIVAADR
jgi:N-acetylglucosamine-6-phosphate deacetylase